MCIRDRHRHRCSFSVSLFSVVRFAVDLFQLADQRISGICRGALILERPLGQAGKRFEEGFFIHAALANAHGNIQFFHQAADGCYQVGNLLDVYKGQEDKRFIAQVYSYIFIGLMLDWIRDDMREDPQLIVERLAKLIKGSMSAALSRFAL